MEQGLEDLSQKIGNISVINNQNNQASQLDIEDQLYNLISDNKPEAECQKPSDNCNRQVLQDQTNLQHFTNQAQYQKQFESVGAALANSIEKVKTSFQNSNFKRTECGCNHLEELKKEKMRVELLEKRLQLVIEENKILKSLLLNNEKAKQGSTLAGQMNLDNMETGKRYQKSSAQQLKAEAAQQFKVEAAQPDPAQKLKAHFSQSL